MIFRDAACERGICRIITGSRVKSNLPASVIGVTGSGLFLFDLTFKNQISDLLSAAQQKSRSSIFGIIGFSV
jgi:hypothetical protein